MARIMALLIGALTLLAACEAKIGKDADKEAETKGQAAGSPAEGKAKEGEFSIDAPGFDMKVDIPGGLTTSSGSDSDMLYPGSTLSGMHIGAGKGGSGQSGVELRFTTTDAPKKVAAWYRNPARSEQFSIESARREGGAIVIAGKEKQDGDPFTIHLSPRSGGGTDARVNLTDSG